MGFDLTRKRVTKLGFVLLVVVTALSLAAISWADDILPDGDIVSSGDQSTVSLGSVGPGAVLQPKTSFRLTCDGKQHVDSGQTLPLSFTLAGSSVPTGGSLSATDTSIGQIPASWPDDTTGGGSTNCPSPAPAAVQDNGDSTITITAPTTPGLKTYVVRWSFGTLTPAGNSDNSALQGNHVDVTYTLTVVAPTDSTPPVITPNVSGTLGNNGWYTSDVTLSWTVTDPDSAVSSPTGCGTTNITSDTSGTTLTCSATSAGGTSSQSVTIKRDATAPTINGSAAPAPNANGWNSADVTVSFTCSDARSGIASCASPQTIATEGAGQSATGSATDSAGNSASTTVSGINIDKTKPTASANPTPAANTNGWNNTNVTVSFSGGDTGGSGIDFCDPAVELSSEGAGQSASGTCTDKAGNVSDAATASGINIDKTAPTITDLGPTTQANLNGWYDADVTNGFKAEDGLSGLGADCLADFDAAGNTQSKTTTGEGTAVKVTSDDCTDVAGNTADAKDSAGFKVDKTDPVISDLGATAGPNANGWYKANVVNGFKAGDALSGLDSACETAFPDVIPDGRRQDNATSGEGSSVKVSSDICADRAGNSASAIDSAGFKIDKTSPTVALVGGPANGASYYYGFVPAAPTCTSSDALSGIDGSCSVSGYSGALGSHTVSASASDKAGNSGSDSITYTVLAWTVAGFYQPVDMNGVWNTVKNGSTVPLKFEIFAGTTELTTTGSVKSLTYGEVSCGSSSAPADEIETTATGGTVLRYDTTGGQFVYNWKAQGTAGKCYSVKMTTQDGSSLTALFKLK
jgi:hypothetical protein